VCTLVYHHLRSDQKSTIASSKYTHKKKWIVLIKVTSRRRPSTAGLPLHCWEGKANPQSLARLQWDCRRCYQLTGNPHLQRPMWNAKNEGDSTYSKVSRKRLFSYAQCIHLIHLYSSCQCHMLLQYVWAVLVNLHP
jgi:hypothetical protein